MPCFFNNASCTAVMQTANGWTPAGGADVCTAHYTVLSNDVTNNGVVTYTQGALNDYIKIGLLMRDSNRVLAELQHLEASVSVADARHVELTE